MTHDYKRHGTIDLFAAMNVATGQVHTHLRKGHAGGRRARVLQADRRHRAPRSGRARRPGQPVGALRLPRSPSGWPGTARWHLHFTPTSSSWLNLIERWFKELTDKRLRRGVFTSVADLAAAITTWAEHWNTDPNPFVWKATADGHHRQGPTRPRNPPPDQNADGPLRPRPIGAQPPYHWQASRASSTARRSCSMGLPRRATARPIRYFTVLKCRSRLLGRLFVARPAAQEHPERLPQTLIVLGVGSEVAERRRSPSTRGRANVACRAARRRQTGVRHGDKIGPRATAGDDDPSGRSPLARWDRRKSIDAGVHVADCHTGRVGAIRGEPTDGFDSSAARNGKGAIPIPQSDRRLRTGGSIPLRWLGPVRGGNAEAGRVRHPWRPRRGTTAPRQGGAIARDSGSTRWSRRRRLRLPAGHDLADSQSAHAVLVLQPTFALFLVDGDDLLRDPVDVLEEGGRDRSRVRRGGWRARYRPRAPSRNTRSFMRPLTKPISAHERINRYAVLGEPARILQCRGRRLNSLDGDVVAQRVQNGVHVALDAGAEQLDDPRIAAQLGDRPPPAKLG